VFDSIACIFFQRGTDVVMFDQWTFSWTL